MRHVVLVTVDSLRADHVDGPDALTTLKTIPRLKAEGTYFTNAYSNAAYTKASFLSIMSGTYPWMFDSVDGGFGPDRPHVAESLAASGYATGGFHTNTYLSPTYGYDRGFDHYLGRDSDTDRGDGGELRRRYRGLLERALATEGVADAIHLVYRTAGRHLGIQLGSQLYRPAASLNDAVVEWTRDAAEPQFAWVHYMDVHNPYYPQEGTVSEGMSRRRAVQLFHEANEAGGETPAADVEDLKRLYRGEIEYLDRQLGSLLERLDETLGLENTVLVFTSDHGEAFGEHGTLFHQGSRLYEENVHVPLLVWGAGVPSARIDTPVSNVDVFPTILAAAGVEAPLTPVGDDLLTLARSTPTERLVFAEAYRPEDGTLMVTDGRYKLIRRLTDGSESLYDLGADPGERQDLVTRRSAVATRLGRDLDRHLTFVREHTTERGHLEVGEDVRLQLRRLGYDE